MDGTCNRSEETLEKTRLIWKKKTNDNKTGDN